MSELTESIDVFFNRRSPASTQQLRNENEVLKKALAESVRLQSHYATLLNQYDGGERLVFKNAREWLERLVKRRT